MKLSNELKKVVKKFLIRTGISLGIILLLFLWVMILFTSSDDTTAKEIATTMMIAFLGIAVFVNLCIAIFTIPYKAADNEMKKSGARRAEREYKKEKITAIDKSKYEGYYREILSLNSPLVVSYIDDFQIEESDLVAELFHLKMHGVIDISGDKIILLREDVPQNEVDKYIIDCIKKNQKLIVNKEILEKVIATDTFNWGLVKLSGVNYEKIENNARKIEKSFSRMIPVATCILILLVVILLGANDLVLGLMQIIAPVIILVGLMLMSSYKDSYKNRSKSIHSNLPFKRTDKGERLNEKIEGLKNFTKDYTLLDERTLEEIVLWEDYLVYSVLWGQNENEIKKYENYVGFEEVE